MLDLKKKKIFKDFVSPEQIFLQLLLVKEEENQNLPSWNLHKAHQQQNSFLTCYCIHKIVSAMC